MKVNLVIQPGNLVEVQLPEGDTLVSGGKEVAGLFKKYTPVGPRENVAGWIVVPYDIDPYEAPGVLGTALQREARANARR